MANTRQITKTVMSENNVLEMPEATAAPEIPGGGVNKISKIIVNRNEINAIALLKASLAVTSSRFQRHL